MNLFPLFISTRAPLLLIADVRFSYVRPRLQEYSSGDLWAAGLARPGANGRVQLGACKPSRQRRTLKAHPVIRLRPETNRGMILISKFAKFEESRKISQFFKIPISAHLVENSI